MRYFYDTEFLEDGRTIDLISIGIVAEDGREYYAVNSEMPARRIRKHSWLMENVIPHLPQGSGDWRNHMPRRWLVDYNDARVKTREKIRDEVRDFLLAGDDVELWADYCAYDHVALAQLFGPMIDLPSGIPMFTNDFQQKIAGAGWVEPEREGANHNALDDARHLKRCYEHLTNPRER